MISSSVVNKELCPHLTKLTCGEDEIERARAERREELMKELMRPLHPDFPEIKFGKIRSLRPPATSNKGQEHRNWRLRKVIEDGKVVFREPARRWEIFLKDELPTGCDIRLYHLQFVEKVSRFPRAAYCYSSLDTNMFEALLTNEEYAKLCGMSEVAKTEEVAPWTFVAIA